MASEETKQDVFKELHDAAEDVAVFDPTYLAQIEARYAAALPDDIATVPADVGERIKLFTAQAWMLHNSAAFARAWLDGVWRVEETGEVVKL